MNAHRLNCCGITEYSGFSYNATPAKRIKFLLKDFGIGVIRASHVIFSENERQSKTPWEKITKLQEFINRKKLGKVTALEETINPNSRTKIRVFIWTIDATKTLNWHSKELEKSSKLSAIMKARYAKPQ